MVLPRYNLRVAVFLTLLFWCGQSFAPDAHLPEPLRLALSEIEEPQRFAFLNDMQQSDLNFFHRQLFVSSFRSWDAARRLSFGEALNKSSAVTGALGELYLNAYMRQWLQMHPKSEFIDNDQYVMHNPQGTRPDGLVVRRTPEGIVVEKMLESKMGGSSYSRAQIFGMIEVWKVIGIRLPDGTHYPPEKIFLPQPEGNVPVSHFRFINGIPKDGKNVTAEDREQIKRVERNVMLFANRQKTEPFDGEIVYTPFTAEQLYRFTDLILASGWLVDPTNQSVRELLSDPKRRARVHENLPPLETSKVASVPQQPKQVFVSPDLDAQLEEYIRTHLAYPSIATNKPLAQYLVQRGGRMAVFAELLDAATQEALMLSGKGPAIGPMEHWLATRAQHTDPDRAEHISNLYAKHYPCAVSLRKLPRE
jgi:hypothetical protein